MTQSIIVQGISYFDITFELHSVEHSSTFSTFHLKQSANSYLWHYFLIRPIRVAAIFNKYNCFFYFQLVSVAIR